MIRVAEPPACALDIDQVERPEDDARQRLQPPPPLPTRQARQTPPPTPSSSHIQIIIIYIIIRTNRAAPTIPLVTVSETRLYNVILREENNNKNGELLKLQSPSAIVILWLPFVYYYAIFFQSFFSSRKKVNEPKENLPCRKTGFRRKAHTRARQWSWPTGSRRK